MNWAIATDGNGEWRAQAARKSIVKAVQSAFLGDTAARKASDSGMLFDAESQIQLGERFAAGMKKAIGGP